MNAFQDTIKKNKTILIIALLIIFPIAGVPLMWIHMKWHIVFKLLVTIFWLPATIMFYSNLITNVLNWV